MSSSCHSSARSRPPSRSCGNKNNRKIKVLKVSVDNDHKSMIHAIKDLISVSTAGESSLSWSYLLKMCKQINKHIEQLLWYYQPWNAMQCRWNWIWLGVSHNKLYHNSLNTIPWVCCLIPSYHHLDFSCFLPRPGNKEDIIRDTSKWVVYKSIYSFLFNVHFQWLYPPFSRMTLNPQIPISLWKTPKINSVFDVIISL